MPSSDDSYDSGTLASPYRRNQMSSNEQWIFGAVFAGLLIVGFAFGLYTGAPPTKPKPTETAELKKDTDKPATKPADKPADKPATVTPTPEPKKEPDKPKEPDPEPKKTESEPKKTETEPKKTEPEPKKTEPKTEPKKTEPPKPAVRAVAFKEVQPILKTYCNNCHGDVGKPKGGVDLRTLAAINKGDAAGNKLVVPGDPEKSPLYESITAGRMPDNGGKPPNADQMALLRDWILGGAKERRRTVRRRKCN